MAAPHNTSVSGWASKRPTPLERLAAISLVLVVLFYAVVKPLVVTAWHGATRAAGAIVEGVAQQLGAIATAAYVDASAHIERDPTVTVLLGQPVVCQSVEQATFLAGQRPDEFEFEFDVVGPRATGKAHVVVAVNDAGSELTSIVVTVANQSFQVPTAP